jgi:DNA-binding PadR family transcriptional regulator
MSRIFMVWDCLRVVTSERLGRFGSTRWYRDFAGSAEETRRGEILHFVGGQSPADVADATLAGLDNEAIAIYREYDENADLNRRTTMRYGDEREQRFYAGRHEHRRRYEDEAMTMAGGRGRHRTHGHRGPFPFGDDPGGRSPFGGFGPFMQDVMFGRRPKVGRGDVRTAVMRLLAEEPRNGYQLIQELTERSGGVWRPSPGAVYPALQQLEDEGLVRAEEKDGKRAFRLTEEGQGAVKALGDVAAPWETAAEGFDTEAGALVMELRTLIAQVASAVVQVAQAGNEAQIARAKELMTQTRRSLYRILAEDDEEGGAKP